MTSPSIVSCTTLGTLMLSFPPTVLPLPVLLNSAQYRYNRTALPHDDWQHRTAYGPRRGARLALNSRFLVSESKIGLMRPAAPHGYRMLPSAPSRHNTSRSMVIATPTCRSIPGTKLFDRNAR